MSACHETLKIGVPLPKNGVILALNPKNGPFDNSVLKSLHFKTVCPTLACNIPGAFSQEAGPADSHIYVCGARVARAYGDDGSS